LTAPRFSKEEQAALRSWLKLLGTGNTVRKALHARLQASFGISLSRFDVLAGLYRTGDAGIRLSELSKQLMVSNGNVTQVITPLIKEGYVERQPCPDDARAAMARLSPAGRAAFEKMAAAHAGWVDILFEKMSDEDHQNLARILDKIDLNDLV
jgi:DNA-binding MarR family transcriptional regulator